MAQLESWRDELREDRRHCVAQHVEDRARVTPSCRRILRPRIGRGESANRPRDMDQSRPQTRHIRQHKQAQDRSQSRLIRVRKQSASTSSPRQQTGINQSAVAIRTRFRLASMQQWQRTRLVRSQTTNQNFPSPRCQHRQAIAAN